MEREKKKNKQAEYSRTARQFQKIRHLYNWKTRKRRKTKAGEMMLVKILPERLQTPIHESGS